MIELIVTALLMAAPPSAKKLNQLGQAAWQRNDVGAAVASFEASLQVEFSAQVVWNLARSLEELGRRHDAHALYSYLRADPKDLESKYIDRLEDAWLRTRDANADRPRPDTAHRLQCPAGTTLVPPGATWLERGPSTLSVFVTGFCLDHRVVTGGAWERCASNGGCGTIPPPSMAVSPEAPQVGISWSAAAAFCASRGAALPSEAQWLRASSVKPDLLGRDIAEEWLRDSVVPPAMLSQSRRDVVELGDSTQRVVRSAQGGRRGVEASATALTQVGFRCVTSPGWVRGTGR